MLNWFKSVFGITPKRDEPLVLENPIIEEPKKTKTTAKKSTTKKAPAAKTTEAPKKRGRKPKASS